MRDAVCTICTEVFDSTRDVSALRCGHMFHGDCLTPWLSQSLTCPQCRQKVTKASIIHKLFFSRPDGDESFIGEPSASAEVSRLTSKLEEVQNKLCLRDREMAKTSAELSQLSDRINLLTAQNRSLEVQRSKELDNNKMLRAQLTTAQYAASQLNEARQQATEWKKKVTDLQNVQTVINGSQDEIDNLIRETSDPAELATWCAVYKVELARKRSECHSYADKLRKAERDKELATAKLADQTTELSIANGRIATLEDDIAAQNKEIASLRSKLEALESALASPGDTTAGLARRLIKESPAPSLLAKTPKLSSGQTQEIDLDTSADLFATPKPVSSSPGLPRKRPRHANHQKAADRTFSVPSVRKMPVFDALRTASCESVGKQGELTRNLSRNSVRNPATVGVNNSLLRNIANNPSLANIGGVVGRKIPYGVPVNVPQSSSVFREGYNGLGGHDKVVIPPAKSYRPVVGQQKKLMLGGAMRQVFGPSKTAQSPLPSLPSLDNSIDEY